MYFSSSVLGQPEILNDGFNVFENWRFLLEFASTLRSILTSALSEFAPFILWALSELMLCMIILFENSDSN